jgi:dihydrofolate reductase
VRPLPNRRNIVITDIPGEIIGGCEMAYSIDEAVKLCDADNENFVMGGASVYRQFLAIADKLYITRVHKDFEADTFFEKIDPNTWELAEKTDVPFDKQCALDYTYEIWKRKERISKE